MYSMPAFRDHGNVIGSIAAKSLATSLSLSVAVILVSPIVIVMGVPTFGAASATADGEPSAVAANGEASTVADEETIAVADGDPSGPPAVLEEQAARACRLDMMSVSARTLRQVVRSGVVMSQR